MCSITSVEQTIINGLLALSNTVDAAEHLRKLKDYVLEHRNEEINLKGAYKWKLGTFEDTIYSDDREIMEDWEQFYLPDHVRMQVLGQIYHGTFDLNNAKLVLMICEDKKIYAYAEQHLHLVAKDLTAAMSEGITIPSETVYHYGQSFEDLTDEELDKMRASEETKKAKEMYRDEVWEKQNLEGLRRVQERRTDEELNKMRASEETKKAKEMDRDEVWEKQNLEGLRRVQERRTDEELNKMRASEETKKAKEMDRDEVWEKSGKEGSTMKSLSAQKAERLRPSEANGKIAGCFARLQKTKEAF